MLKITFLIACMLLVVVGSATKEGKMKEFHLKSKETLDFQFQISNPHIVLYVRPSEQNEDLQEKLERKHQKSKSSKSRSKKSQEDDDRILLDERMLSKDAQSPGRIEIHVTGQEDPDNSVELDNYYSTAFFKNAINKDQVAAITIVCQQGPCQGTITAYSQGNDTDMKEDEEQKLSISKTLPIRVFTITIPDKKDKVDRLVVSLRSSSESLVHDHVSLDVFGDASVKTHQQGGKMFLIVDVSSKETCNGCQIDVVLSADNPETKSHLYVSYSSFMEETLLTQDLARIDYLGLKENLYKIALSSKYEVFKLRVTSFMGQIPHILANLDERPDKESDYTFDSILSGDVKGDQLSILFRDQELDGTYLYVMLKDIQGVYQIEFSKSRNDPVVMIDELYVSQLKAGSVHTYLMKAFPAPNSNELYAQIGAYQLGQFKGEPQLKLFLKACSKSFCDGEQFKQDTKDLMDQHSTQLQKVDERDGVTYKLKPSCDKQDQDKDGYCWYGLAVLSTDPTHDLHYLITSSLAEGSVIITANQPFSAEILEADVHQLIFFYEKQKGDIAIIFSISTPTVAFLISSNAKCQPVVASCAKYSGGQDSLVTLRGDELREGAYYIAVEGLLTSQYSITVQVQNKKQATIVTLDEGQSHRSELHPGLKGGDIMYFSFVVDFDKVSDKEVATQTTNPDIQINVLGSKYKLAITLRSGEGLPSTQDFDLISLNGFLSIEPNDSNNYVRKGVYNVAVEFIHHDTLEDIEESSVIPFTISYRTSRTLKYLNLNQANYDIILSQKTNVYFFLYNQNKIEKHLLLSKQHLMPLNADLKIYLGSDPQRHQDGDFELYLNDQSSSTFEIKQETFNKLCDGTDAKSHVDDVQSSQGLINIYNQEICQIFIFVENHSSNKVTYSLTLWNPNAPIELHEGHPQQYNLASIESGQFLLFTYAPVSYSNEVQIIIQSYFGQLSYKLLLMQRTDDIQLNIKQLDSFQAAPHNTHSKTLATTAFQQCQPDCVLHIQVFPDISSQQTSKVDDTFSIVVSQKFLDVQSGQHIEVTVSHASPRYFLYSDVKGLIADTDNTLIITLQEFVGRGAMCIAISNDDYLRIPFIAGRKTCDFEVIGNRLELGSRNVTNLITGLGMSATNNPVLIIEVSSFVNVFNTEAAGKFELFIEKSKDEKKSILLATPYKIQIPENQNTTLSYFNYLSEDIEIKVTRLSGYGWLSISYCLDEVKAECKETNVEDIQSKFLTGQSQTNFVIATNSKDFCVYCTYYFKFQTQKLISLLALVTVTSSTQFVRLSQGVNFLDYLGTQDQANIYRVPFDVKHQTEVIIKVYEGSPELWLGMWPHLDVSEYQYGPYTVEKFREQLKLTEDGQGFFEAILPPRQHLLDNQDKYNISALGVNTLAAHFVEDDLYLLIRSTKPHQGTNYSILITQGTNGASNAIEDGILTKTVLSRMIPSTSFFYYHLSDNQPLLILKVVDPARQGLPFQEFIRVTAQVSPSLDHTTVNLSNMINTELTLFSKHVDQVAYQLPNITGFYKITITNVLAAANSPNKETHLGFNKGGQPLTQQHSQPMYVFGFNYLDIVTLDVAINSQDLFLLESNTWMQGIIKPKQANFYEMYISQKGQLAIQLQNCNGDLKLQYTQDYQDFLQEKFESSNRSPSGLTLDTIINVKEGPIYLSVHSDSTQDAIYNIQTSTKQQGKDFPHGKLLLGGDGQIKWSIHQDDPDKMDISFKPLKCNQCDIDTELSSEIVYEIVWSTQELYLNTLGKCGAQQFLQQAKDNNVIYGEIITDVKTLNSTNMMTHLIDVGHQSDSQQIFLSVRAKVQKFQGVEVSNYVLFYENVQVGLPKNVLYLFKHKRQEFALGISILFTFVVMLLFCICYFYKRLRTLKKVSLELELEQKMNKAIKQKNEGQSERKVQEEKYGKLEEELPEQNL